jgi:hypothetical protein
MAVAGRDPDTFRATMEILACLALPREVFARPGITEKINDLSAEKRPSAPPGPNREELLRLIDA